MTGAALPWRGPGAGRPDLPLPPDRMPLRRGGRRLKRWRYLGVYCREEGTYTLEEAIRHLSSHAARRHHLHNRGHVWPGFAADLVLFDPQRITDRATYEDSRQMAEGVHYVWVNGRLALDDERLNGDTPGRALRHRRPGVQ